MSGEFKDVRTRFDSVEARGVRSGMLVARTPLEFRRAEHQGMDLKCAMGSAVGWLWVDLGFAMAGRSDQGCDERVGCER